MSTCCASCGIAEVDDIKLMECDDCDLVRYCSDECKENHRSEHEEACKKRAAELRDELLFKQPESSHIGDCPICSLPLPLGLQWCTMYQCCSKFICNGCEIANKARENNMRLRNACPFCRLPLPKGKEKADKLRMKRVKANNPVALLDEGMEQYEKGEYSMAFEYFTKAAALGYADAHYKLGNLYLFGHGAEKDEGKRIHHWEEAAIGGHPWARHNVGAEEYDSGNKERAVKHWIIAAKQGDDNSIKQLMDKFREGHVSKEDLDANLRAHKAAVDATKSPQRTAAEKYYR